MEDFEKGTFDFTKDGKCCCCGECCSNFLPMTSAEIKVVKRYVKDHDVKEKKHLFPINTPVVLDFTCPFLDSSKKLKCTIYEVRPSVCKEFSCNPALRKPLDTNGMHLVDMRKTFFGS